MTRARIAVAVVLALAAVVELRLRGSHEPAPVATQTLPAADLGSPSDLLVALQTESLAYAIWTSPDYVSIRDPQIDGRAAGERVMIFPAGKCGGAGRSPKACTEHVFALADADKDHAIDFIVDLDPLPGKMPPVVTRHHGEYVAAGACVRWSAIDVLRGGATPPEQIRCVPAQVARR